MVRIFCDFDEVFMDFTGAACKVHGWTRDRLEAHRAPGDWGMAKAMRMSTSDFWKPIQELGEDFWIDMPLLPWANDLVRLLNGTDWYIVTSPVCGDDTPICLTNWTGKVKALHKHFGWRITRCHITPFKEQLSNKGAILIDDRESNITKFSDPRLGGEGILFPSLCNGLFALANDPIPYVKSALERKHAFRI